MKSAAAITISGVLRKSVGGTPIPAGTLLYRALAPLSALILLADHPETDWQASGELSDWLMVNNFTAHADIVPLDSTRLAQVNKLRARGYALEFVIEPDPAEAGKLIKEGHSVLSFLHAQYAVPSWRPDYEQPLTPWDDLAAGVEHQARMRAHDAKTRLRIPE